MGRRKKSKKKNKNKNKNKNRVPKTLNQKLFDLDAHLFFLRDHLKMLQENPEHLKVVSAELRTLICSSYEKEGLLWRLVDELEVDDRIFLHVAGKVNPDHPLAKALAFSIIAIQRGGKGDPRLPPYLYSLKDIIKNKEALYVGGLKSSGKQITHEYLIKAIAQQMGTAHEDEGLEPTLDYLKKILINGIEPFIRVLATDGELTLEVGERIIEHAEQYLDFKREYHRNDYGDVSIVIRFRFKQLIAGRILLVTISSYVSNVDIECTAGPTGVSFNLRKRGMPVKELFSAYPKDWKFGDDAVFVFSYSSKIQSARTITNEEAHSIVKSCDIGWVHASDLRLEKNNREHMDFIAKQAVLFYGRLLSSKDSQELQKLPPDLYGLWKYDDEFTVEGAFPE